MDKEFLKEQNLEGAQSRFQSILEYVNSVDGGTFMQRKPLAEAEDDMPMPDPQGAPEGMPEGMPGDVPPQGDMGGEMPPMEEPMGDTNMGAENFNPNVPPQEPEVAAPAEEEEEEVIDVDDLTDAQEETKDKVSDLDTKIDKFIGLIDKLESEIDKTNQHIEDLRQDFEKRNPTPVEKLTLRSSHGYPFSETPEDYWKKKEEEGHYSVEDDENGANDERYKITKRDIDSANDWHNIYKSIEDDTFSQNLNDIFKY